jgi:hypothetical protein
MVIGARLLIYGLDRINQAADESEKGGTIKPVIRMNS